MLRLRSRLLQCALAVLTLRAAALRLARCPRYTSMTFGSLCTSSIVPFGEHAAFVQHRHRVRAMLRTKSMSCSTTTTVCSPASAVEQLGGALGLLVRHAGHGLVHQQHLRVLRQQHADLEPLLLAVRRAARLHAARSSRRPIVSSAAVDAVALLAAQAREQAAEHALLGRAAPAPGSRTPSVAPEHGGALELAADAEARDLVLAAAWSSSMLWPCMYTRPWVGPGLAGDHVHHRGLARAVRADDAAQLARLEHQRSGS